YELKSLAEFPHWHPAVTLGEAAAATVVSASSRDDELELDFRSWGDKRHLCFVSMPSFPHYFGLPVDVETPAAGLQFFSFGSRLMEFGARKLAEHFDSRPQLRTRQYDAIFGHSASDGLFERVLAGCGLELAKGHFTHAKYANT